MKKIFTLLVLTGWLSSTQAQQIVLNTLADDGQEAPMKLDTVTRITSFSARCINDTAYLMWTVAEMHLNGVFIVYRSGDGIHFGIIATKNVPGVPIEQEIGQYFKDVDFGSGIKYYRLVYINALSQYLVSQKITVHSESKAEENRATITTKK